jgi:sigma-B regulation protein RsbU (phosphoserine phosphatase)
LSKERLQALENELAIANKMQQSILPTTFPETSSYQVHANMEPAREVGGDFFDIMGLRDGEIGLAIADVSDKGIPAALLMVSSRTMLKGSAISFESLAEALAEVNSLIYEENDSFMFVTVFYAVYDPSDGWFTYANGGHEALYSSTLMALWIDFP